MKKYLLLTLFLAGCTNNSGTESGKDLKYGDIIFIKNEFYKNSSCATIAKTDKGINCVLLSIDRDGTRYVLDSELRTTIEVSNEDIQTLAD